jgi:hypothetical protein
MSSDPSNDQKPEHKPMSIQEALAQAKRPCIDQADVQAASEVIADVARMLEELAQDDEAHPREE